MRRGGGGGSTRSRAIMWRWELVVSKEIGYARHARKQPISVIKETSDPRPLENLSQDQKGHKIYARQKVFF